MPEARTLTFVWQRWDDSGMPVFMKLRVLLGLLGASFLPLSASAQLTSADTTRIINQAVTRAVAISPNSVIAVTDREGDVLAIWVVRGGAASDPEIATAVSKAGTAAYLSSNQGALTSRTAGFIIQQHFPPGVNNAAPGPLVGVGLSNLFFSDINKFRKPGSVISFSATPGNTIVPVPLTSLDGTPGGLPLYKNGRLVGGIGVTGDGIPAPITGFRAQNPFIYVAGYDKDEDIALAGQRGFTPSSSITANNVLVNGIRLAYVNSSTVNSNTYLIHGNTDPQYPTILGAPPPFPYPPAAFGGVTGEVRQPIVSDPIPGPINGQARLTAAEVGSIISYAAARGSITRAAIRLPIGSPMQVFITVVNNPNMAGVAPTVLGTFRMAEATLFSWDVAIQKARTVVYYSTRDFLGFGSNISVSVRCVGFLAQCNYPPGIDGNPPGPFNGQQELFSGLLGDHCHPAAITPNPVPALNPNLPNGITIFPGAFGLYRNGVLVGAIGISGDGVDQDDIVAASGTQNFLAPTAIRSDQFIYRGTRLPYAKFPRDPSQDPVVPVVRVDFNYDRKPDLSLSNSSTRRTAVWYMNNNVYLCGRYAPTLPTGWRLVDVADFDRDGNPDYLLFNSSTRQTAIWYLSGQSYVHGVYGPNIPSGWNLSFAADLNRDGRPDYVLYNPATRQTGVWFMNNNHLISGSYGPTLPAGWTLVGLDDFDRDGKTDYLLFNSATGQSAIWYLSNVTFLRGAYGPTIATGYALAGADDFSGDGKSDFVLWNRTTGRTAFWYLNNNIYLGGAFGPVVPAGYDLIAP